MKDLTISVPASSANIGPGFDSAGIALNRYLSLRVTRHDEWSIRHKSENLPPVKNYEDHLIFQIAKRTAAKHKKTLPTCKIDIHSNIPLTRGLGSSAAAVIAGIELANQLCKLSLTVEQRLQYGTMFEGHADNVAPALLGGLVITANIDGHKTEYNQLPTLNLDVVLYIPNFELKTQDSRKILPETLSRKEAAKGNGISNLMISSLLLGDYEIAGRMMEHDLFHEPYRAKLIPHYADIKQKAKEFGAYGTVISGAGPTMISFVPKGKGLSIANQMSKILPNDYLIREVMIDQQGLQVRRNE